MSYSVQHYPEAEEAKDTKEAKEDRVAVPDPAPVPPEQAAFGHSVEDDANFLVCCAP